MPEATAAKKFSVAKRLLAIGSELSSSSIGLIALLLIG